MIRFVCEKNLEKAYKFALLISSYLQTKHYEKMLYLNGVVFVYAGISEQSKIFSEKCGSHSM